MARRRLIIKHVDPFSVLKFGAIAHAALLVVGLVLSTVVWLVVTRIGLIDRSCEIASDVGFTGCGVTATKWFGYTVLLGVLWAVVQTAVLVFLAFLHNLIADLTGGVMIGVVVEGVGDGSAPRPAAPRPPGPGVVGSLRDDATRAMPPERLPYDR